MTLKDLSAGKSGRILKVGGDRVLREHLIDMGVIPGTVVKVVRRAPLGDPVEIDIRGYQLSFRQDEASMITIEKCGDSCLAETDAKDKDFGYNLSLHEHNAHPGYGEEGKYHSHQEENPLPKGTVLNFAIVGQQNSGKTTLFNLLTGSAQRVGNFPGVTVDRHDAPLIGYPDTLVTDLPGLYSLTSASSERNLARDYLLNERPKAIINVVDAGNIERNLYLTLQLIELGIPMVVALNMMDEVRGNGGSVRLNEMERLLGVPVVPVAAARGEGIEELVNHAVHVAKYQEKPACRDLCGTADNVLENVEDRYVAIAQKRFDFIEKLCARTVVRPSQTKEYRRSEKIDRILTGRWTAIPLFLSIIFLVIWLTVDVIGAALQDLMSKGIDSLAAVVEKAFVAWNVSEPVRSLVVDAVFGGVGSVLSFAPIIVVLFFFLSMLEDTGYMSRIAFVSDKMLSKIGLSGRSIVPMLIGFGCSVPGVMATRTLPSARDRKLTVLMMPFMSCSAKITIYTFLAVAFFPKYAGLILAGLYLLGIFLGVMMALGIKLLRKDKEASPFVMELPNYRLPKVKNVAHLMWDKTKDFIQNAFTVIFVASVVIWLLQSFNFRMEFVPSEESMLSKIAGLIAPAFAPLGLGDWRAVVSLISGFIAKESVVSTMEVLGYSGALTAASAASLLVFSLLYTPCVAAVASIRRELGRRWSLWVVFFQCALAWVCAFAVHNIFF